MSRERAHRRAVREAQEQADRAARARTVARRSKRRELARKLVPKLPDRRVGKLYPRRSRAQRAMIAVALAVVVFAIWTYFDDLTTRIALTAIVLVAAPAIVVVAFGRRS